MWMILINLACKHLLREKVSCFCRVKVSGQFLGDICLFIFAIFTLSLLLFYWFLLLLLASVWLLGDICLFIFAIFTLSLLLFYWFLYWHLFGFSCLHFSLYLVIPYIIFQLYLWSSSFIWFSVVLCFSNQSLGPY